MSWDWILQEPSDHRLTLLLERLSHRQSHLSLHVLEEGGELADVLTVVVLALVPWQLLPQLGVAPLDLLMEIFERFLASQNRKEPCEGSVVVHVALSETNGRRRRDRESTPQWHPALSLFMVQSQ